MTNINTVKNRCFGCGACANACPVGAIKMQTSPEGFLYPVINDKKCIKCGLCASVCPALSKSFAPNTDVLACYAAYSNDNDAMRSSSGGVFGLLATDVLSHGGYVCGAAFDDEWMVRHIVISSVADLDKLRVSKYLQSDTNNVFAQVRDLLTVGKKVLFSGTPCQVAGLYGFLGRDYENLLTCDIFCHGAPSPAVWKKYITEIARGRKITHINFRDKEPALNNPHNTYNVTITFENREVYTMPFGQNIYMNGFLSNLYLRQSCATCKFAHTPRRSDITLGDFWGFRRVNRHRDVRRGISAIIINTARGMAAFDKIRGQLSFIQPVKLSDMVAGNPVLCRPCVTHPGRGTFMQKFQESDSPVSDIIEYGLGKRDVAIMNFASRSTENYGASLVGYAVENAVRKLGYRPYTVRYTAAKALYDTTDKNPFRDFAQQFLNMTGVCTDKASLVNHINDRFNIFIVGSDQIIRHPWHHNFIYYLDWVRGNKTLLMYAPSFGHSNLGMNKTEKRYAKKCLDRFDALSVREHSGADIFKREFGFDNVPVLCDPTMLLDAADYQPIIDASEPVETNKEYVAYYLLDASSDVLAELGDKYQLVNAYRDEHGNFRPIGQWLSIIKNAKYVVTDSFHGSVFSMIFHRQFVTLTTDRRGNDRIDTLMRLVGENRLRDYKQIVPESAFDSKLDYKKIAKNISDAQARGYDYLKNALAIQPNYKKSLVRIKSPNKHSHSFWWHLRHLKF